MTMNRLPLFFLAFTLSFSTTMTAGSVLPEAARSPVPPPPLEANAWLLIDHETGTILAEHNVDERVEPASLTKMMTTFVVLERIRDGALRIEDEALVSDKAWKTDGS
jgi:D-alanyl-D-alanine carboxypeptidase (penicillin-binding protein 5/6)